jgi:hypothetical protein
MLFYESAEVIVGDSSPSSACPFRRSKYLVTLTFPRCIAFQDISTIQPTAGGNYGDESRPD